MPKQTCASEHPFLLWLNCLISETLFLLFGLALQGSNVLGRSRGDAKSSPRMRSRRSSTASVRWSLSKAWSVWPSSCGCICGLFLLNGGTLSEIASGDLWVILSSFFWALHVILVGVLAASSGRPLTLACVQFSAGALLSMVCTLIYETPSIDVILTFWPEILFAGAISVGIAFTLQVVGQRYTHPADAALILVLEMPFAALAAALFLEERLSFMSLLGCGLILASVIGAEILPILKNTVQDKRT